jgi:hypothetical protein
VSGTQAPLESVLPVFGLPVTVCDSQYLDRILPVPVHNRVWETP